MNPEQSGHPCGPAPRSLATRTSWSSGPKKFSGPHNEDDLPAPATAFGEVDIAFLNDPSGQKADQPFVRPGGWSA
jgi:hypothetical protein